VAGGDARAAGSTHAGRPAPLPSQPYEPPPPVARTVTGLDVPFFGEDGRNTVFRMGGLPLPGWHAPLAEAFAERVGPAGTRRTLSSATVSWGVLGRFVRFLDSLPQPPATPRELTAVQVDAYLRHRVRSPRGQRAWEELIELRLLVGQHPLRDLVDDKVLNYLARRVDKSGGRLPGRGGYSDGELARLVDAARADVAGIRDRIDAGEALLAFWLTDPASITGKDAVTAARLAAVAETGVIPRLPTPAGRAREERNARTELAQRLFVTRTDREPLLVLLAAVTGRNSETLKELPAEHRVLDGAAVELRVIKRRQGPQRWFDTVTWEIGPPHRQLHTPGGLYLLLHRLMARGRAVSGSPTLWSIWRNAPSGGLAGPHEHADPFAENLAGGLNLKGWATGHDLRADPTCDQATAPRLEVGFRRIRTSIEVRRTRAVGGHLPSAARSNTVGVLFTNYLRADATARQWAEDVVGDAVADAEQAALAAHRHALATTGATTLDVQPTTSAADPASEGAWTACTDPHAHPATGRPCRRMSYLDCFHCGNCLITRAHLPAILALVDELSRRRGQLGEADWWRRYGPIWAAIRGEVLPKFTPAELRAAGASKPAEALLELAEDPWEQP
jgi:hypothetical protein